MPGKVIRITDEALFGRLLMSIRHHEDPENLVVELLNGDGDVLIYDNGRICMTHGEDHCWIRYSQLCGDQRSAIEHELRIQVHRVVDNIIFAACLNAREVGRSGGT